MREALGSLWDETALGGQVPGADGVGVILRPWGGRTGSWGARTSYRDSGTREAGVGEVSAIHSGEGPGRGPRRLPPARRPRAAAPWPAACRRSAPPPVPRPSRCAPSSALALGDARAPHGSSRAQRFPSLAFRSGAGNTHRPGRLAPPSPALFPPPRPSLAIELPEHSPLHRSLANGRSKSTGATLKQWARLAAAEFGLSCYGHQIPGSFLERSELTS